MSRNDPSDTSVIERLVVAIDGSELSREAFEYAGVLAEAAELPMQLLHVIEHVAASGLPDRASQRRLDDAREILGSAEMYCQWRGIDYSTRLTEGKLIPLLTDRALPGDLICVGMKGRFAKSGLGSTTRWLVRHVPCPVMVVSGPALHRVNRLIGVYDGSKSSARAVAIARDLSQRAEWPQTVLVVPRSGGDEAALDRVLEKAPDVAGDAQIVTHAPGGETEAERIERIAATAGHSMLVVGAYTHSWLHQLFFDGTTSHLLTNLNAPVILVH